MRVARRAFNTCCQCRRQSSIASQLHHAESPDAAPVSDDSVESVQGWVRSFRRQKSVTFAVVTDGSNVNGLQTVIPKGQDDNLANGCSVRTTGRFVDSPGRSQRKEFQADRLTIVGTSEPESYPITNTKQGIPPPLLRKNAHLRPRTRATSAMLRLRSEMTFAVHDHFRRHDFLNVQTPIVTSSDCEGAGEVFRVVSDKPSEDKTKHHQAVNADQARYLTVSSQLHLEALASSFRRVYTLSPAFRAEKSDTARHLQEFWMLEGEESFLPDEPPRALEQVMSGVQDAVQSVLKHVLVNNEQDLAFFESQTAGLVDTLRQASQSPYERISYNDAVKILREHRDSSKDAFVHEPKIGSSIQTEHEKFLAEQVIKGPVFVTDYPAVLKPWYMLPSAIQSGQGCDTVACFDLLVPRLGELVGGSLREHRLGPLVEAMKRNGIDTKQYDWYLDLRKYGTTPHGGWGLGWERLVAFVTGLDNVRDCIAFPRATEGSRF